LGPVQRVQTGKADHDSDSSTDNNARK